MLQTILNNIKNNPDLVCYENNGKRYAYKELYAFIKNIYNYILTNNIDKTPVVVIGHKEIYVLASFLACSFAGVPYVPIDTSMPQNRINQILDEIKPTLIIDSSITEIMVAKSNLSINETSNVLNSQQSNAIVNSYKAEDSNAIVNSSKAEDSDESAKSHKIEDSNAISKSSEITIKMQDNDIYYIIFTSGSTGTPKGVKVSYKNLKSCMNWLLEVANIKRETILNQANFSFDLSIADIYLSLLTLSKHYVLPREIQKDFMMLFNEVYKSKANLIIATPTFLELLLTDKSFNHEKLPSLEKILFCGEKLTLNLVKKIYEHFPNISIINCYGPTECTFAVTSTTLTASSINDEDISIGVSKKDCNIYIVDENLNKLQDESIGEILITGESVALGYVNRAEEKNKFITFNGQRAYLTGDLGYYKNNELYCIGRNDSQIKFKGYRIELLDIEKVIEKLSYVDSVVVTSIKENGIVKRIVAFVKLNSEVTPLQIKKDILVELPDYMLPTIKVVTDFPLNANGKKDVKKLTENYING